MRYRVGPFNIPGNCRKVERTDIYCSDRKKSNLSRLKFRKLMRVYRDGILNYLHLNVSGVFTFSFREIKNCEGILARSVTYENE